MRDTHLRHTLLRACLTDSPRAAGGPRDAPLRVEQRKAGGGCAAHIPDARPLPARPQEAASRPTHGMQETAGLYEEEARTVRGQKAPIMSWALKSGGGAAATSSGGRRWAGRL
jgi:hypothetical protein